MIAGVCCGMVHSLSIEATRVVKRHTHADIYRDTAASTELQRLAEPYAPTLFQSSDLAPPSPGRC